MRGPDEQTNDMFSYVSPEARVRPDHPLRVIRLMTDDVLFLVPGQPPFGKQAFAKASEGMKDARIEGTSEIQELQVMGDWAYLRNHLTMTVIPPGGGEPIQRSGHTLTILRREADGKWRLARDANLMTATP